LFSSPDVDDEAYRRRILIQLNRGEARHRLARAVFHGQRGELRQRYREGQEDQLGALGVVVNAIILWNTRYMERAPKQLQGYGVTFPNRWLAASCVHRAIPTIPTKRRSSWPKYRFFVPLLLNLQKSHD
jgi:TnpA family transposase